MCCNILMEFPSPYSILYSILHNQVHIRNFLKVQEFLDMEKNLIASPFLFNSVGDFLYNKPEKLQNS